MSTEDYAAPIDLMMPNRIQHEMHMSESMLRDHVAAKVLQGFCANPAIFAANSMLGWDLVNCTYEQLCGCALAMADIYLAERSKP